MRELLSNFGDRLKYQVLGKDERDRRFIFGVGLSRTGTTSLCTALGHLGYRMLHYPPIVEMHGTDPKVVWPWWMNRFDGGSDLPVAVAYPQLAEMFPNAVFFFTGRNMDRWLESTRHHFRDERVNEAKAQDRFATGVAINQYIYGRTNFDESAFRDAYMRHEEAVTSFFKGTDRLHKIHIADGDGWEKLCPPLGIDIPDTPFPLSNARKG